MCFNGGGGGGRETWCPYNFDNDDVPITCLCIYRIMYQYQFALFLTLVVNSRKKNPAKFVLTIVELPKILL